MGPEGHRHAEEVRRAGANGHESVHAGGSVKQLLHEPSVELPADPELDRRGEGPEEPRIAQPARGPGEDLVHAADQHRDREGGSHEELPLEEPVLAAPPRLLAILRFGRGRDLDGHRVPGGVHGLRHTRHVTREGRQDDPARRALERGREPLSGDSLGERAAGALGVRRVDERQIHPLSDGARDLREVGRLSVGWIRIELEVSGVEDPRAPGLHEEGRGIGN